jgi:hypothetical protein
MSYKQGFRAAIALAVAAPLALAPSAFADNPHGTPPGQAKAEGTPATPVTPAAPATPTAKAKPAHPAHPAHPAKPAKPAHPVHPAKPAKPAKPAAPSTGGKSGAAPGHNKITICHATGSATNPYVTITIPPPAVAAHSRHQDGRDIIPAPAGGCPTTAPAATTTAPAASSTTSTPADGTTAAKTAGKSGVAAGVAAGTASPAHGTPSQAATPSLKALARRTAPRGRSGVLAETAHREFGSGTPAAATATRPADAAATGSLPFTGFDAALVLVAGLAALLAGATLRRATRTSV